ncbi:MAG: hypothetical protein CVU18_03975 [Betaproteobacteria bacterium HGW-Betaproteobacteria-12]|nr:MAG: hypothetical protein CVU18_03975 [Betaproteobacteria bacterium HGW-Betaproteobacteria-12]
MIATPKLHNLEEIPEGMTVGDFNPAFAGIRKEIRVGKFSECCTCCRKPFNAVRKPRRDIRLYPADIAVPIAWAYPICGRCAVLWRNGGSDRESVLAAVEAFHLGDRVDQ